MQSKKGVITKVFRKKISTKFGEKMHVNILLDDDVTYNIQFAPLGFAVPAVGDIVQFGFEVKQNGQYTNHVVDKNSLEVVGHSGEVKEVAPSVVKSKKSHLDPIQVNIMASHAINNAVSLGATSLEDLVEQGKLILEATDELRKFIRGETTEVKKDNNKFDDDILD